MTLNAELLAMLAHLGGALLAGGVIGLERSFHGRPAGFRTHALVALASAMLMVLPVYQQEWVPAGLADEFRTDPTRMAQGIMTGIGFLGAGVIFRDGLSVRGLTTAASIWATSAIGILIGIGFWVPAVVATLLTLGTLSAFLWVERRLPSHCYAHHQVRFARDQVMPEPELRHFLAGHGFSVANMSYRASSDSQEFEYRMVLRTLHEANLARLATALAARPDVRGFRLSPTGE